jgi:hypothetical protein
MAGDGSQPLLRRREMEQGEGRREKGGGRREKGGGSDNDTW